MQVFWRKKIKFFCLLFPLFLCLFFKCLIYCDLVVWFIVFINENNTTKNDEGCAIDVCVPSHEKFLLLSTSLPEPKQRHAKSYW